MPGKLSLGHGFLNRYTLSLNIKDVANLKYQVILLRSRIKGISKLPLCKPTEIYYAFVDSNSFFFPESRNCGKYMSYTRTSGVSSQNFMMRNIWHQMLVLLFT